MLREDSTSEQDGQGDQAIELVYGAISARTDELAGGIRHTPFDKLEIEVIEK